jgi:hypothetical protein
MGTLHRGHLFHLGGRPTLDEAAAALVETPDGGVRVDGGGVITWSGAWSERPAEPGDEVVDHGGCFLLPGFVDTHLHFPQVYTVDAHGGGRLLDWLERCVFPAEARLADDAFAAVAAGDFCRRLVAAGTTTSLVFGSAFPEAQEALFEEYARRGLRGVLGRGIQTVGPAAAAPLVTGEEEAIRLTEAEIERWHPESPEAARSALLSVAVVPRFALSVTRRTLEALGELCEHYRPRGVYFTTQARRFFVQLGTFLTRQHGTVAVGRRTLERSSRGIRPNPAQVRVAPWGPRARLRQDADRKQRHGCDQTRSRDPGRARAFVGQRSRSTTPTTVVSHWPSLGVRSGWLIVSSRCAVDWDGPEPATFCKRRALSASTPSPVRADMATLSSHVFVSAGHRSVLLNTVQTRPRSTPRSVSTSSPTVICSRHRG